MGPTDATSGGSLRCWPVSVRVGDAKIICEPHRTDRCSLTIGRSQTLAFEWYLRALEETP